MARAGRVGPADGGGRRASLGEVVADAVVHAAALLAGLVAVTVLMVVVVGRGDVGAALAVGVYAATLIALFGFSAAYNLAPVSPVKALLRRFDHSAIYLLIAGTYTPYLTRLEDRAVALGLGAVVWVGALAGVALKVAFPPDRFPRLSLAAYLLLGWVIVIAFGPLAAALPPTGLALLVAGGLVYTAGVAFHLWEDLKFQRAIWHLFVAVAAGCHFAGIAVSLTAA
jgi:hemolysin III